MPDGFEEMWAALLPVGRAESGGYRRPGYGAAERELHAWFADQCRTRGLRVEEDRNGNTLAFWDPVVEVRAERAAPVGEVRAERASKPPPDAVLTGSHLDSVPDGGAYDGPLGVVSALAAVDVLRNEGFMPARPIVLAAFAEEEGSRFGVPCLGSRLATGRIDPEGPWREAVPDAGPADWVDSIGCFVELHVEQGRWLVDQDAAVGVGTAIAPHGRYRFRFEGAADHAGSTRMEDRHDPMLTFAMTALAANKQARLAGQRATFGRVEAEPNATNAIPSAVTAWLDARAVSEDALEALVDEIARQAKERSGRDGTTLAITGESTTPAVGFDADLTARIAALLGAPALPTYAGHDAGVLQQAGIATTMLFVRNPTGVSHAPAEHAEMDDCLAGVDALAATLRELAG